MIESYNRKDFELFNSLKNKKKDYENIYFAKIEESEKICSLINSYKILLDYEGDVCEKDYVDAFIKNPMNFVFVFKQNDLIVGVITGVFWDDKKYAEIIDLAVKKNLTNKGVGKLLINFCIDLFNIKGYEYFTFYTKESNVHFMSIVDKVDNQRNDTRVKKGFKAIHYAVDLLEND